MKNLISPLIKKSLQFLFLLKLTALFSAGFSAEKTALTQEQKELHLKSFEYVWTTIRDQYWDPDMNGVDWNAVRDDYRLRMEKIASDEEAMACLDDLVHEIGKTHFNIIPAEFYSDMTGTQNGFTYNGETGIEVTVINDTALVDKVWPGSGSEKVGVRPGWIIHKIGQDSVSLKLKKIGAKFAGKIWLNGVLNSVVEHWLTGQVGDTVHVDFIDAAYKKTVISVPLLARRGKPFSIGYFPETYVWVEVDTISPGIGYIAFSSFMAPVEIAPVIYRAIRNFMSFDGIIFDLRGNGGGMGEIGMGIAGWLVPEETYFGELITRQTRLKFTVHPRPVTYKGPVAVLVDAQSACATEIFSDGLRSIGRGRVFGSQTAGAALASVIERLPNGLGFQYPFANYMTRNGVELEGHGLTPDELVEPTRGILLQGRDQALEAAVEWIIKQKIRKRSIGAHIKAPNWGKLRYSSCKTNEGE